MTPRAWFIFNDGDWTKVPLITETYEVEDASDLKIGIKAVLSPSLDYYDPTQIILKAVKSVPKYEDDKSRELLKNQAFEISGRDTLAFILQKANVDGANDRVGGDLNIVYSAARKSFAENIWLIAELPARDRPTLEPGDEPFPKRPRLEEHVPIFTWFLNLLRMPQAKWPKLLPPVPKTQIIITEGNVGIYAGEDVPIGEDDFEKIVTKGYTFVDKTLLISDFLECSTLVSLVVRPRRFGKTTNLTMLKNFFAYPIEPDNKKRRQELFINSKIWNEKRKLFEKHFCNYPVIFINLKDFRSYNTWQLMEGKLRRILANLYEEHSYACDSLSSFRRRRFNLIRNESAYPRLADTLKELSEILRIYYGRECIVLIDEYDHPFDVAFHRGFYDIACDFFSSFLGGLLKSNGINVYKALLVGVTRVTGHLSDLNNVKVYPMFDILFADKFGFTDKEVDILLQHHQKADHKKGVKDWYDGYGAARNICLYNPWSIISFIQNGILRTYWTDTASTRTIQKLIWYSKVTFKNTAARLLKGEAIEVGLKNNLYYDDISRRVDDALWTLLYYAGYLTQEDGPSVDFTPGSQILYRNTTNDTVLTKLRIPNAEVMAEWRGWLQLPGAPTLNSVVGNLLNGELQNFHRLLADSVIEDLSFNDVGGSNAGKKSESFYHGYFLGWLAYARFTGCTVKSNREAGLGRFDALIEYRQDRQAAIIEYKVRKKKHKQTIEAKAEEALSQIEKKEYCRAVSGEIELLAEVGVAFQRKLVVVVGKVYKKENGVWVEKYEYQGKVLGKKVKEEDGEDNDSESENEDD